MPSKGDIPDMTSEPPLVASLEGLREPPSAGGDIRATPGVTSPSNNRPERPPKPIVIRSQFEGMAHAGMVLHVPADPRRERKRACFKDPTEITRIVRKANETLVSFKERCIVESGFIVGVPEVMKISSFMDAHKCPELANMKVPKDEVSKASKKLVGTVSRREDRFLRGRYRVDRRRNDGRNAFNIRDGLAPYRHQTYRGDHQGSRSASRGNVRVLLRKLKPRHEVVTKEHAYGLGRFRRGVGVKVSSWHYSRGTWISLHGSRADMTGEMAKEDEEKIAFYTDQGTYCYTKIPFGLKSVKATYQRLVDTAFQSQIGRNLKACMDDMVIKSNDERMIIADITETFDNLQKINMNLNPKKCSFKVEEEKFLMYMVTSEGIRANPKKTKVIADMQSSWTLKEMQSLSGKLVALKRFLSRSAERSLPFFDTLKDMMKENKDEYRWTEDAEKAFEEMKKVIIELLLLTTPERKKRYMLRRYFEAHPIKVIRDQPLKQILNKAQASGKLAKYSVELGTYNITYDPTNAIKGQVLVDFLSEAPGVSPEEFFRLPEKVQSKDAIEKWTLFTNGASNVKGSGVGLVLISLSGTKFTYALRLNFTSTSNEAEYEALLTGLRLDAKIKVHTIDVKVDSKLVAIQINENYVASSTSMIKYLATAKECIEILVEVLLERSTYRSEVNAIVKEKGDNWMPPIIRCLAKGIWPEDKDERRSLRMKINQYVLEEGVLFKKGYLVPMLRCVGSLQADYVIGEIHMGSCGMHIEARSVVAKAIRHGYYWPTMYRDARNVT
nr:hypothetical protein [Tanacetum cinerariifolium]